MFKDDLFLKSRRKNSALLSNDDQLKDATLDFINLSNKYDYAYQRSWLGQPIIQLPEDIVAAQELIYEFKPDCIIETGISWGGSTLLYASILELIGNGVVIAIDKCIPDSIKEKLMGHSFSKRIKIVEGDITSSETIDKISKFSGEFFRVAAFLDTDHSHNHVLNELYNISPLISKGQFISVYATALEYINEPAHRKRLFGKGNNPLTAINEFLECSDEFELHGESNEKTLCSFAPSGRLIKVR